MNYLQYTSIFNGSPFDDSVKSKWFSYWESNWKTVLEPLLTFPFQYVRYPAPFMGVLYEYPLYHNFSLTPEDSRRIHLFTRNFWEEVLKTFPSFNLAGGNYWELTLLYHWQLADAGSFVKILHTFSKMEYDPSSGIIFPQYFSGHTRKHFIFGNFYLVYRSLALPLDPETLFSVVSDYVNLKEILSYYHLYEAADQSSLAELNRSIF